MHRNNRKPRPGFLRPQQRVASKKSRAGFVSEGFIPEGNVWEKFKRINPAVSLAQTIAFVREQMRQPENRERFAGAYVEKGGKKRLVVPIRAANETTEQYRATIETQQRKTFQENIGTRKIPFEQLHSKFPLKVAQQRIRELLKTRKVWVRRSELASAVGISADMIEELCKKKQLHMYFKQISAHSIKKLFGLPVPAH